MSEAASVPRYVINWREHPVDAALSMGHNFINTPWQGRKVVDLTSIAEHKYWQNDATEETHPTLRLALRIALCFTVVIPLLAYIADRLFQSRISIETKLPSSTSQGDDLLARASAAAQEYIKANESPAFPLPAVEEAAVTAFRESITGLLGEGLSAVLFAPPLKLKTDLTHPQQALLILDNKAAFLAQLAIVEEVIKELQLDQDQEQKWQNLKDVQALLQEKTDAEITQLALRDQLQGTPVRDRARASLNAIATPGSPLRKVVEAATKPSRSSGEEVAEAVGPLTKEETLRLAQQTVSWAEYLKNKAAAVASHPETWKFALEATTTLLGTPRH